MHRSTQQDHHSAQEGHEEACNGVPQTAVQVSTLQGDRGLPREDNQTYELQYECKYIKILMRDVEYTEFKDGSSLRIYKCEDKSKCTLYSPAAPHWYSRTITLEMLNQLEDNNHLKHRFTLGNEDTHFLSLDTTQLPTANILDMTNSI